MENMDETLLKKARELFDEPDVIIDLFDMTFIWVSQHILDISGYSEDEMLGKQVMEFFSGFNIENNETLKRLMKTSHGKMNILAVGKDSKDIKINAEFYTIQHDDGYFHIGKI